MAPLGPIQKPPPIWVVSNPRLVDDSSDDRMVRIMKRACRRIIRYGDGWMTCCRAEHPEELTEQIGYLEEAASELDRDFADYTVAYQVTMNIADSEAEAKSAFDAYISQYYPELSQAMDLSNWGPVGHARADRGLAAGVRRPRRQPLHLPLRRPRPVRPGRALRQAGPARLRTRDREVIEHAHR